MKPYLLAYLGSMLAALVGMPWVIALAKRLKLVDKPHARKIHSQPTPRVGGIGIFLAAACVVVPALWAPHLLGNGFRNIDAPFLTLIAAAAGIFLMGLVDDFRSLSGQVKLLALVVASVAVCGSGARIDSLSIGNLMVLKLGVLSWPVTILWIAGVTVGLNFIDGADGLAAGISAIGCAVIAVIAVWFGQAFMGLTMLALAGSLSGFLFYNFNPAKTFMGDCGSMLLGFTLGAGTVVCASSSGSIIGISLPAVALGIPLMDAACTMVRRGILERRSIFKAERGHIHHRLLDLGLGQKPVVLILYAVTLVATILGSFMLITSGPMAVGIFVCVFTLLFLAFQLVGSVQLRETVEAIRNQRASRKEMTRYKDSFEEIQLQLRVAQDFEQWWNAICQGAHHMSFAWISMTLSAANGDTHTSVWRPKNAVADLSNLTIMKIPIPSTHQGLSMEFEVAIPIDSTLESASQRATLFSRLLDETDVSEFVGDTMDWSAIENPFQADQA